MSQSYHLYLSKKGSAEAPDHSEYAEISSRSDFPKIPFVINASEITRGHFLVQNEDRPVYLVCIFQYEVCIFMLDAHTSSEGSGKKTFKKLKSSELGYFFEGHWNDGRWWLEFRKGKDFAFFTERGITYGPSQKELIVERTSVISFLSKEIDWEKFLECRGECEQLLASGSSITSRWQFLASADAVFSLSWVKELISKLKKWV